MRLKKNLIQLVESDYTPLQANQEGLLRGGFGAMAIVTANSVDVKANVICKNPECKNGVCENPQCSNNCTINNCATPSPSPSPSPESMEVCSFLSF